MGGGWTPVKPTRDHRWTSRSDAVPTVTRTELPAEHRATARRAALQWCRGIYGPDRGDKRSEAHWSHLTIIAGRCVDAGCQQQTERTVIAQQKHFTNSPQCRTPHKLLTAQNIPQTALHSEEHTKNCPSQRRAPHKLLYCLAYLALTRAVPVLGDEHRTRHARGRLNAPF